MASLNSDGRPHPVHGLPRCWPKPLRHGSHSIPMRQALWLPVCPSEEMRRQRSYPACQGDAVTTGVPSRPSSFRVCTLASPASGIACPRAGLCPYRLELPTVCPALWATSWAASPSAQPAPGPAHRLARSLLWFVAYFYRQAPSYPFLLLSPHPQCKPWVPLTPLGPFPEPALHQEPEGSLR